MSDKDHILSSFNQALDALRGDALMMASLAQRSLDHAIQGLLEQNRSLCGSVIADDEEIDLLEKQIDQAGMNILMRFQPVASDLRAVVAAMRMSGNLERIADLATNIARRARKLQNESPVEELHHLDILFEKVPNLVKDAVRAFAEGDLDLAHSIKERDREIDRMNTRICDTLTSLMSSNPDKVPGLLGLILVSRSLERVGDHATNIAEDAVFSLSAEDIRHPQARPPES